MQDVPAEVALLPVPMTDPPRYFAAALMGVIAINRLWLRDAHRQGKPVAPLYAAGVIYHPEQKENFLCIPGVLARGFGDCDDLTAWRVAELRESGQDPGARPFVRPSKSGVPGRFHALVLRGDGTYEDPSAKLGMMQLQTRKPMKLRVQHGTAETPTVAQVCLGEHMTEAAADDWPTAAGLAAKQMLQLQRLNLVKSTPAQREQTAAIALFASPGAQAVMRQAIKRGILNKDNIDKADKILDTALAVTPPPYGPAVAGAKAAIGMALGIVRKFPSLRAKQPSFLR